MIKVMTVVTKEALNAVVADMNLIVNGVIMFVFAMIAVITFVVAIAR